MLERNIKLIYLNSALMWGRFFIPVLTLFYIASQVNLEEYAIIMSVFALTILLLEVPSGVFADLLGKKNALLLSRGLLLIEVFLLAVTNGFWFFLIAKIISGIGVSLNSGTDESLLYDTLKKLKRTKEYKEILGKRQMYGFISQAIVFIIGAWLFTIHYKLPVFISLIPLTLVLFTTLQLKEPYQHKEHVTIKKSYLHLKNGLQHFLKKKTLWFLVLFSIPLAYATEITLSLSSRYFEIIHIPISLLGIIAFIGSMLLAMGSKYAVKIDKALGAKKVFLLIALIGTTMIILETMMIPYWGVLFYLIFMFLIGLKSVLIINHAQDSVTQKHRATMISTLHLFAGLSIFIVYLIIGPLMEAISLQAGYIVVSSLMFAGFCITGIYYEKNKKKIKFT